ncbi:MAG: hypothetical protein CMC35_07785 [Flavobacteriaceae bacterium]|nr:hypothetical protein [Flavobacteriaceae bacterium]|tara:strand:- start:3884 stop:4408 length:525 start_codon:yes stop_codon:yes gene_type:complete
MKFEGSIFYPAKEKKKMVFEEKTMLYLILFTLVCFLMLLINDTFFEISILNVFLIFLIAISLVGSIYNKLSLASKNEAINGTTLGEIVITETQIILDQTIYRIQDVTQLRMNIHSYRGKPRFTYGRWVPGRENGTKNTISFRHDDQLISRNFIITNKTDIDILKRIREKWKLTF